jgi:hypothetical protein
LRPEVRSERTSGMHSDEFLAALASLYVCASVIALAGTTGGRPKRQQPAFRLDWWIETP